MEENLSIKSLVEEIKKYENYKPPTNDLVEMSDNEEIVVIVGDSRYPNRGQGVSPKNVNPFGIYNFFGFNEVAFLCDIKTLELFSIVGILFDSLDDAANLINELLNAQLMDAFARYLWYEKRVMLVNANGTLSNIDNLLGAFKNHKILFCWGKKKGYSVRAIKNLSKAKSRRKYDSFMRIKHPSPHSYMNGFVKACNCYMDRTYRDKMSNLTMQDFKIF